MSIIRIFIFDIVSISINIFILFIILYTNRNKMESGWMHGLILLTIGWMGRKIVGWMPPLTHQSNGYNRNPMENGWLHGLMLLTM